MLIKAEKQTIPTYAIYMAWKGLDTVQKRFDRVIFNIKLAWVFDILKICFEYGKSKMFSINLKTTTSNLSLCNMGKWE